MSTDKDTAVKEANYSPKLEAELRDAYAKGTGKTIAELSVMFDRPERSIRSKLVSMREYVKPVAVVKTRKDEGPSKKAILADLGKFGFTPDTIKGLEHATKGALAEVLSRLPSVADADADVADVA